MLIERPLDVPVMQWVLFLVVIAIALTLFYLQMQDDHLDLRWLIMDNQRRPVFSKIAQIVALTVSTWAFVVSTLRGTLGDTFFLAYMAVWSGSVALESYFSRNDRGPRRRDDPPDYEHEETPRGNPYDRESEGGPR